MVSPRTQDDWPISDPRSQNEEGTLPKNSLRWFYWVIFKPTLWWLGYQLRYLWRLVRLYWVVRISNIRQYRIKKKLRQNAEQARKARQHLKRVNALLYSLILYDSVSWGNFPSLLRERTLKKILGQAVWCMPVIPAAELWRAGKLGVKGQLWLHTKLEACLSHRRSK